MAGFLSGAPLAPNALEAARAKLAERGERVIDLTQSNPTAAGFVFEPRLLTDAAARYAETRKYEPNPRGSPELRRAICRYYEGRTPHARFTPDQIFITASTSESYGLLLSLLCDSEDELLAPQPGYPLVDLIAAARSVKLSPYALESARGGWRYPEAVTLTARTRAAVVVSPGNPTGAVMREPWTALRENRLPIICDEVFSEFPLGNDPVPPLTALHPERPVFLLNGASKMFAAPDLKVGWIALNDPAAAEFGERLAILNDVFLSASPLSQRAALEIFETGRDAAARIRTAMRERLMFAQRLLAEIPRLSASLPDAGAFLYVRFESPLDDEAFALRLLEERRVLVHPAYFYGSEDRAFVISTVVEESALRDGVARIASFMKG